MWWVHLFCILLCAAFFLDGWKGIIVLGSWSIRKSAMHVSFSGKTLVIRYTSCIFKYLFRDQCYRLYCLKHWHMQRDSAVWNLSLYRTGFGAHVLFLWVFKNFFTSYDLVLSIQTWRGFFPEELSKRCSLKHSKQFELFEFDDSGGSIPTVQWLIWEDWFMNSCSNSETKMWSSELLRNYDWQGIKTKVSPWKALKLYLRMKPPHPSHRTTIVSCK